MIRFSYRDLITELMTTCHEYIKECRQQVSYYNASVYKSEIVHNLERKIKALRTICELIGKEELLEPLRDYDSMRVASGNTVFTDQTSVPGRTLKLCSSLEKNITDFQQRFETKEIRLSERELGICVKRNKRKLLSICRRGTRSWAMLQWL